jgi:hypothetical protein
MQHAELQCCACCLVWILAGATVGCQLLASHYFIQYRRQLSVCASVQSLKGLFIKYGPREKECLFLILIAFVFV